MLGAQPYLSIKAVDLVHRLGLVIPSSEVHVIGVQAFECHQQQYHLH